jgi:hypothetical protein
MLPLISFIFIVGFITCICLAGLLFAFVSDMLRGHIRMRSRGINRYLRRRW